MGLLSNGQVTYQKASGSGIPLFRLAFRPFFWLGPLFGVLSICLWGLVFSGHIEFSPFGGSYFWHVHEMLFGFTVAIIVGFLLTAVQNWTGVSSIKGMPLALLVLLWGSARLLMAFPHLTSDLVVRIVDLLFLPLAAFAFSIPIVKARMWRNLFLVPVLLFMGALNILMHFSIIGSFSVSFIEISHMMVVLVSLVICIIGGRVFPMFTANGTRTPRVLALPWLEKTAIISILLSILVTVLVTIPSVELPKTFAALIYLIAGVANFARAWRWQIWVTFSTPLVWSLHLSYWAVCLGFIMLGLAQFDVLTNASLAYHAITVGGISWMVLSMISRVSLGHTGRPIQVGRIMLAAFLLMGLAFLTRVIAPLLFDAYSSLVLISSMLWGGAFVTFLIIYTPILFAARVDGGQG
ncbi:NnrS family protein [Aliikangiella sp. G2MR2-5]|uniref:NnrS family protein n=1 Tax=Aliikangiella sp. G2MR2-5 TaxID=2788943 RepID=UPI0018AA8C24|nr:NnrS family protein [Aliikangiella sp. G2MR2-5]